MSEKSRFIAPDMTFAASTRKTLNGENCCQENGEKLEFQYKLSSL
jgi:hypothetical protein